MKVVPMTLREANDFIESHHRHNGRTSRDGGKYAIGCEHDTHLVGVAIVGRPLSRILDDNFTTEILRTCVLDNAPKGTNSFLYGRCWRIWQQMGGTRMVTYTLESESGSSLKGAGWNMKAVCKGHKNGWSSADRDRVWQPIYGQTKFRWEVTSQKSMSPVALEVE
jgi:hypothetical protein